MKSRERVIRAIEFKEPDHIPVMHACLPQVILQSGQELQEIFDQYPSDFGIENLDKIEDEIEPFFRKGKYEDKWGCVWENAQEGIVSRVKSHPMKNWEILKSYQFPRAGEDIDFNRIEKSVEESGHKRYILGWDSPFGYISIFERMYFLRRFEDLFIDLIHENKEVMILADKILDYNLDLISKWLELDIDGISFGDDWETQNQLQVNPEVWRKVFKPGYKKMFEAVHNGGKHVHFHSDGYILEIIQDLIEIGVDVLIRSKPDT